MKVSNYFLTGEVGMGSDLLHFLSEETGMTGAQPAPSIVLHINSPGGDFLSAMQIINIMRSSPVPITTIVNGVAESAALMILMAGHRRAAFRNSTGMAHHLSTTIEGNFHKLKDMMSHLNMLHKTMAEMWRDFSNLDAKLTGELMLGRADLFMDAETMLRYGIIDDILDPGPAVHEYITRL